MILTGDTIKNPVTGERVTFLATSADTDGDAVVIETVVQPGGFVAAAHVHPAQSERFAVAAGTAHRFWNAGADPVRFVCEVRPALQFESLLETMFALAADGKTGRKGMPNPLCLAVIARAHFDTVRLPFPPAWIQRTALALGSPVGRAFGYRPTYLSDAGPPTAVAI